MKEYEVVNLNNVYWVIVLDPEEPDGVYGWKCSTGNNKAHALEIRDALRAES